MEEVESPLESEKTGNDLGDAVDRPAKVFRPVPFALALALSIGLLVLLAVAAVLILQYSSNRANTLELLNEKAESTIARLEDGVSDHLKPLVKQADYIADRVADGSIDIENKDQLVQVLMGALSGTPEIEAIAIWDRDLQHIGVERGAEGSIKLVAGDGGDNAELQEVAQELTGAQTAFWGEVVFGRDHSLINLRRPLRRDGQFLGFLVSVITVPQLSDLVKRVGARQGSTAFILFGRDRVLAHPFLIAGQGLQSKTKPLVDLSEVDDSVLRNLWQAKPVKGFELAADQEVHVVQLTRDGQGYVVIYKWIDSFGEVPWLIGAWYPAQDLEVELERLWRSGVAGVVVLIVSVIAAVLLGRFIAAPIRKVAASAAQVGDLDLIKVAKLPPSKILELDDQARSFNRMLDALRSFETYVPRRLVQRLIRRDGGGPLSSREQEVTVMFTDIVGFTSAAENLSAAKVAAFLNRHFEIIGSCVEAEGGTVDKFIGDGMMAFWGAPDRQSDTARRACRAALAIAQAIKDDNKQRAAEGKPAVRVRIGIHSGNVVVGDVGWPGRINYTIVGDAVNTCQRLEQAGKQEDQGDVVNIFVSGQTLAAAGAGFQVERARTTTLRGRQESVEVFRLIAEGAQSTSEQRQEA